MYRRVQSNVLLRSELANVLRSTLQTNANLARNLPIEAVEVYSTGFRDAISAVATAYDVDLHISDSEFGISATRSRS